MNIPNGESDFPRDTGAGFSIDYDEVLETDAITGPTLVLNLYKTADEMMASCETDDEE